MLTINEFPKSLLSGVKATFEEGRNLYKPVADTFTQDIDSNLETENYVMLGNHRGPQLFTGEVRFSKLKEYPYAIQNLEYYDALEIDYKLLKYAQHGKVALKSRTFGYEWTRGKDKQLIEKLSLGASQIGYDSTPFFGASHVDLDSGVQSNIAVGGSSFDATTFRVMRAAFAGFKDDRGEVSGRMLTHVVVKTGSVDELNAQTLKGSLYTPGGTNETFNPYYNAFEIISSPYVPTAVKFVGLDLSGMNKPIVRQNAGEAIWTAQERDSEWFQIHKQYRYALHQDWGIGYNDWRLAYLQI